MALRGDADLFSLIDEMSNQQGYQRTASNDDNRRGAFDEESAKDEDVIYSHEEVGSQMIWNPTVKVRTEVGVDVRLPTNPVIEVLRRRSHEFFKRDFTDAFGKAHHGITTKEASLWSEIPVPALMERWHFDVKLHQQLRQEGQPKGPARGHFNSETIDVLQRILQQGDDYIDPLLLQRYSADHSHWRTTLLEEIKTELTRAWKNPRKPPDSLQESFSSKAFQQRVSKLVRSLQDSATTRYDQFLTSLRKRATDESTQSRTRLSASHPKVSDRGGDITVKFQGLTYRCHRQHYEKLRTLYDRTNSGDGSFVSALFSLLCRYDMLQGAGLQSAIPGAVFDWLFREFGCTTECFASPLNCRYERYCSAFADTDAPFGSVGSFFDYDGFDSGCFQANPPFTTNFIQAMYQRMSELLSAATDAPLMFVVFVPAWKETEGWRELRSSNWLVKHVLLEQKDTHYYQEGTQHRRKERYRVASFDTSIFFLQNEVARRKWKAKSQWEKEVRRAFSYKVEGGTDSRSSKRQRQSSTSEATTTAENLCAKEEVVQSIKDSSYVGTEKKSNSKKSKKKKKKNKRPKLMEDTAEQLKVLNSIVDG